jgi:hypothetical protein
MPKNPSVRNDVSRLRRLRLERWASLTNEPSPPMGRLCGRSTETAGSAWPRGFRPSPGARSSVSRPVRPAPPQASTATCWVRVSSSCCPHCWRSNIATSRTGGSSGRSRTGLDADGGHRERASGIGGPTSGDVFNHIVAEYLILLLSRLDLFEKLRSGSCVQELVENRDLHKGILRAVLDTGTTLGVLTARNGRYWLTSFGRDLETQRGFLTWMIGGYAPLLESMDLFLASGPPADWRPYVRGGQVAIGSAECDQTLMRPVLDEVMKELAAIHVADLAAATRPG